MGNKGYQLEHEVEGLLLKISGQSLDEPMWQRCHRTTTSGAHRGEKGDVVSVNVPFFEKQVFFECKRRKERLKTGMGFTLPEGWILKNEKEAKAYDCHPFFIGAFTAARCWRRFVVTRNEVCANFLHFITAPYESTLHPNKNGNFKIQKKMLDKVWDKNHRSTFKLIGKEGEWILFTYKMFVRLLEGKRNVSIQA